MPLEDPHSIDIITRSEDGRIALIITDSGQTTDAEARFLKLVEKTSLYLDYVLSEKFRVDHPEATPGEVKIKVLCATPPTEEMLLFDRLTNPDDRTESIRIEYELFAGAMPSEQPESEAAPKEARRNEPTRRRFNLANWVFRLSLLGLFASGIYRMVVLNQAPWTPWLMAIGIWVARFIQRRRRWNKIKADLIAGGVPLECFQSRRNK